jgi:hypothetical protein
MKTPAQAGQASWWTRPSTQAAVDGRRGSAAREAIGKAIEKLAQLSSTCGYHVSQIGRPTRINCSGECSLHGRDVILGYRVPSAPATSHTTMSGCNLTVDDANQFGGGLHHDHRLQLCPSHYVS